MGPALIYEAGIFLSFSPEKQVRTFPGMEGIKLRFARKIMDEEWVDFEKRHRSAIDRRTNERTGHLRSHRKYGVSQDSDSKITATFSHPVYERFLDMRISYRGDIKTRWGTKQNAVVRRGGKRIHNRIIFGKLNPLSFRLMHDLNDEVRRYVREKFSQRN